MKTVLLDPGHGSDTPGKRSPIWEDGTQLFEWEFNRDIVKRIANKLEEKGIPYHILVTEEHNVSLAERVKRANELYQKDKGCYVVSVHANAGGGTGWEVFTSPGETASDKIAIVFAEKAQENMSWRMRFDHSDGDPDKESAFYILRKTACPAILTENGFMDNLKDCQYMQTEEGREAIAKLHIDAICEIANQI